MEDQQIITDIYLRGVVDYPTIRKHLDPEHKCLHYVCYVLHIISRYVFHLWLIKMFDKVF